MGFEDRGIDERLRVDERRVETRGVDDGEGRGVGGRRRVERMGSLSVASPVLMLFRDSLLLESISFSFRFSVVIY